MSFEVIKEFENEVASFFGAPHAVAVDCCTHAIELCLRHQKIKKILVPKRTYISIPFLANKLNIKFDWKDESWIDYYYLTLAIIFILIVYLFYKIIRYMIREFFK